MRVPLWILWKRKLLGPLLTFPFLDENVMLCNWLCFETETFEANFVSLTQFSPMCCHLAYLKHETGKQALGAS